MLFQQEAGRTICDSSGIRIVDSDIAEGPIRVRRIGGRILITRQELLRYAGTNQIGGRRHHFFDFLIKNLPSQARLEIPDMPTLAREGLPFL